MPEWMAEKERRQKSTKRKRGEESGKQKTAGDRERKLG